MAFIFQRVCLRLIRYQVMVHMGVEIPGGGDLEAQVRAKARREAKGRVEERSGAQGKVEHEERGAEGCIPS